MKLTCDKCGKSELYAVKKLIDRVKARKHFNSKHEKCQPLAIKNKNNIVTFPVKNDK